jgi:hypothetical protein
MVQQVEESLYRERVLQAPLSEAAASLEAGAEGHDATFVSTRCDG